MPAFGRHPFGHVEGAVKTFNIRTDLVVYLVAIHALEKQAQIEISVAHIARKAIGKFWDGAARKHAVEIVDDAIGRTFGTAYIFEFYIARLNVIALVRMGKHLFRGLKNTICLQQVKCTDGMANLRKCGVIIVVDPAADNGRCYRPATALCSCSVAKLPMSSYVSFLPMLLR